MSLPLLSENWYLSVVEVLTRGGLGHKLTAVPRRPAHPPSGLVPPPSSPPPLPLLPPEDIDEDSDEFLSFEDALREFRRWMRDADVNDWFLEYQWWVRVSGRERSAPFSD